MCSVCKSWITFAAPSWMENNLCLTNRTETHLAQLEKQNLFFPKETKVGHCVGKIESHVFQQSADAGLEKLTPAVKS